MSESEKERPVANVLNLNKHRKRRRQAQKKQLAVENRVKFGRPKTERVDIDRKSRRDDQSFEQHRLDKSDNNQDKS